jgi:hypothetical protein
VVRHATVANAIEHALDPDGAAECRIGQWRTTITFRGKGASRWPEHQQIDRALRAAAIAREMMSSHRSRAVRDYVARAMEIVYEDAAVVEGCAVTLRWECVVPGA